MRKINKNFTWANYNNIFIFKAFNILFKNSPYLLEDIFHPYMTKLKADPVFIIQNSKHFDHEIELLTRVVLDLWNGSGNVNLGELLSSLDYDNSLNLLHAFCHLCGINEDLIDLLDQDLTLGHYKK